MLPLFSNTIIEGNKNKRKKRKYKKALGDAREELSEIRENNMYEQGRQYIDSQDLNTERILNGPKYSYTNLIKTPREIGMSGKGNYDSIDKNVKALFSYVDVLVKGNSKALRGGGDEKSDALLGSQSFYPTGQSCVLDVGNGERKEVQRFIYQDFRPTGNTPLDIGDGMVKNLRGLVPGIMENVAKLNPLNTFESIMDVNPTCMLLRMPVTKDLTKASKSGDFETFPVSIIDIAQMDPCSFPLYGYRNPATGYQCQAGFRNLNNELENTVNDYSIEKDLGYLYLTSLSFIGLYVVLKLITPELKDL